MNTEEAIKTLERAEGYVGIHYINGVEDPYINPCLLKAIDYAITSLRAQQDRENPKPLTLEELLEMDWEPVWLENAFHPEQGGWEIVLGVDFRLKKLFCRDDKVFWDYGNTWIAYRHKPMEITPDRSKRKCSSFVTEYGKTVCYGTKEREECTCGGDESKCNFYKRFL